MNVLLSGNDLNIAIFSDSGEFLFKLRSKSYMELIESVRAGLKNFHSFYIHSLDYDVFFRFNRMLMNPNAYKMRIFNSKEGYGLYFEFFIVNCNPNNFSVKIQPSGPYSPIDNFTY